MNTFVIRGASAEIKWAWHRAALLESWEIKGNTATAKVVSLDTFKASQQPLTFIAHRPHGKTWQWPIQSLQVAGSTVSLLLSQE